MDSFTKQYSLSKTLRFELKPVGETAEKIQDFKNQAIADIVNDDRQRAEDYKQIKIIVDDYHRDFIEDTFKNPDITPREFQDAFECYTQCKKQGATDKDKKAFEEKQEAIRKIIAERFKRNNKTWAVTDKYKKMLGGGEKSLLYQWLLRRKDDNKITIEEFEKQKECIFKFDKFTTYFSGFDENRKNMYTYQDKATAIPYRIVNDNMVKHFDNCIRFAKIRNNFPDLHSRLEQFKEAFTPSAFRNFINQSGIDKYNYEIIGRPAEDENAKRVNMIINEYIQTNGLKGKDRPPKFTQLFKQILSDRESKVVIDEFTNDTDMLNGIKSLTKHILFTPDDNGKTFYDRVNDFLAEYMLDEFASGIYIKKGSFSNLSSRIWGGENWHILRDAINVYAENNLKTKTAQNAYLKKEAYSASMLQEAIDKYLPTLDEDKIRHNVRLISILQKAEYHTEDMTSEDKRKTYKQVIDKRYEQARSVFELEELGGEKKKEDNLHKIKQFLDAILDFEHFFKIIDLNQKQKDRIENLNSDFYDTLDTLHNEIRKYIPLYNKTRNYSTKKSYKTDKFKINFENSTLLDGWDVNKESDNSGVLFVKDGRYYLGIMRKDSTHIFNYISDPNESVSRKNTKEQLHNQILPKTGDAYYGKMIYKLLPDPSKMLPKVFFADSNIKYYNPSDEILEIRKKGQYKKEAKDPKAMRLWIDFLKHSIKKHPEWNTYFSFQFSPTREYIDTSHFYKEVAEQGYHLSFDKIKESYINEKIESGELYLFEIYNKDFSSYSKGRPNLHTSYWKLLFSPENLNDLVLKLNGQAEIFFRPASLKKSDIPVHKARQSIDNKNLLNPKKKSRFDYDITKDRRFTVDKFFFHCPITFNFKSPSVSRFNNRVNDHLRDNSDINIIGIDRGERHLLYYSVIDAEGHILQQSSFNTVVNSYKSNKQNVKVKTDYHKLLDDKEKQRDAARKSWSAIENIKELKSGYLSHIVYKIASLMIEHNAIVVLEDLNFGFKRGRIKVEKQVYQKFEKALIDKLNYLVFKNKKIGQPGHFLSAYQLTAPFESFQKLGKQSGFLFYAPSFYTSKIDPATGFVSLLNTTYKSVGKSQAFFKNFDNIVFNNINNYFELSFNYANLTPDKSGKRKNWTICTAGRERYRYDKEKKEYACYDVTAEMKMLFDKYNIDYKNNKNLTDIISNKNEKAFFERLHFLLGLTLQLRHSYKSGDEERDYILSPVADKDGNFFDSRNYEDENGNPLKDAKLPANADANGAYNIARKGLMVLNQIKDPKKGRPSAISNAEWFDFAQNNCD